MKISQAKKALLDNLFDFVEIRNNPGNMNEYIVLLHCHDGKSFMLAYEDDSVITSSELGHMVLMLKEVGFKKARIYF